MRQRVKEAVGSLVSLRTLLPIAAIGWSAHAAITAVRDEARSAVGAVSASVAEVRLELAKHEAEDGMWTRLADERFASCCPAAPARSSAPAIRLDAIPPERRRFGLRLPE